MLYNLIKNTHSIWSSIKLMKKCSGSICYIYNLIKNTHNTWSSIKLIKKWSGFISYVYNLIKKTPQEDQTIKPRKYHNYNHNHPVATSMQVATSKSHKRWSASARDPSYRTSSFSLLLECVSARANFPQSNCNKEISFSNNMYGISLINMIIHQNQITNT